MRQGQFIPYTQLQIAEWQYDQNRLPVQIQQLQDQIAPLEQERQKLQNKLAPIEEKISQLQAQIRDCDLKQPMADLVFDQSFGRVNQYSDFATFYFNSSNETKFNLALDRDDQYEQRAPLAEELVQIEKQLNELQAKLNSLQNRLDEANKHIEPAQTFLKQYQENQSVLFGLYPEFSLKIKKVIQQFEIDHPVGQDLELRYELYRLNAFFSRIESKKENVEKPFDQLVHHVYALSEVTRPYCVFDHAIQQIIFDMHVPKPNPLNLHECQVVQYLYPEQEKIDLEQASAQARTVNNNYLNNLIDQIEYAVKTEAQPDAKFYLRILMHAHYAATNDDKLKLKINNPKIKKPQDALTHCLTFVEFLPDEPNTAKKVAGALLLFISTSVAIAAPMAAFLMSGTPNPIIAFGLFKTLAFVTGSAVTLGSGSCLLFSGLRKGVTKPLYVLATQMEPAKPSVV